MKKLDRKIVSRIIQNALREDIGKEDVTTNALVPRMQKGVAVIYAKEAGIIAGLSIAKEVFNKLDPNSKWKNFVVEGEAVKKGQKIAEVTGNLRALLSGERTALNFLQRISGIASITRKFIDTIASTNVTILDTRKTAPGLRILDKYGVQAGGGTNHRFGLYDMVLIKDNHIEAAGGIKNAVSRVREKYGRKYKVEVETKNIKEVKEAIEAGVDIIMLDNMTISQMKKAIRLINGKCKTEASGNVDLKRVKKIASIGVDYISIGSLTHSVKAMDLSMKISNK
ncbi:carboxylating nicotinate-nucleotide diphosphorylase [Melioribacter sp. OK-6-Me]|uniref:carboxylating nicotinate-nucleotide diphosphorylase n=1 Tax=unclassified Melioribacter TaxID=2627329 RepID=UPI003EDB6846